MKIKATVSINCDCCGTKSESITFNLTNYTKSDIVRTMRDFVRQEQAWVVKRDGKCYCSDCVQNKIIKVRNTHKT